MTDAIAEGFGYAFGVFGGFFAALALVFIGGALAIGFLMAVLAWIDTRGMP